LFGVIVTAFLLSARIAGSVSFNEGCRPFYLLRISVVKGWRWSKAVEQYCGWLRCKRANITGIFVVGILSAGSG